MLVGFISRMGVLLALNDYIDLTVLGDYYTNGSYGIRFDSDYALRYKFRGNLSFRYENLINNERGFLILHKAHFTNIHDGVTTKMPR